MKFDNSALQAGALFLAGVLAIIAAVQGNWNIVAMAITGFFGALSIHPKPGADDPGTQTSTVTVTQPLPQSSTETKP